MAPIDQPFQVHLTGFGPFRNVPVNPSWEAVRRLDGTTLESDSPERRTIRITSSLLPVKYSAVLSAIPLLHASTPRVPAVDLFVHVGVGLPGQIRLEQRARKFGYDKVDVEGHVGPFDPSATPNGDSGFAGDEWREFDQELSTTVNGEQVVRAAAAQVRTTQFPVGVDQGEGPGAGSDTACQVELSRDAGLYLCEFTFYCSLATALKRSPSSRPTPVQFVHVPPLGEPYSLDELTNALKVLVWAIVNEGGL